MSYFQRHLKTTVEHPETPFSQARLFQPSQSAMNASKFKKNTAKARISQSHTVQETVRANKPKEINESALSEVSHRQNKAKRDDSKPVKDRSQNRHKQETKPVRPRAGQFATQSNQMDSESMNRGLVNMLAEADNSMQQLLNSSINQFQRYLEDKDSIYEQHNQLMEQNEHLRASLDQLKTILKDKLESALHKQKEELTLMMEDYIRLITKLLSDKEQLTANIEQLEQKLSQNNVKHQSIQKELAQSKSKIEELTKSNEHHIIKTKAQIEDFLQVIDQYQEEAEQQGKQNQLMKQQIEELTLKLKRYEQNQSPRLEKQNSQTSKTQTLIELLQKSQQQNHYLRDALRKAQKNDEHHRRLQEEYNKKLQQFEQEHEQQFMEYDKAVKETMSKKDECIQRLNSIIEGYKQKRLKEKSFDSSMQMIGDHYN